MKKRNITFVLLAIFLVFTISGVLAASNSTTTQDKINNAYQCLNNQITTKGCSSLSVPEQVFSVMATGKCSKELLSNEASNGCWPAGNCNIKTTAQAAMALKRTGADVSKAIDWLNQSEISPTDLTWYLEIENSNTSKCTVSYNNYEYKITIGQDKKISGNPGSCLSYADNPYWLRVSPSCYNEEFTVSCNTTFLTTFLFKQNSESTIHVTNTVQSSSAGGETANKIDSSCFSTGSSCDYEGTLWASILFSSLNKKTSSFLPYLSTNIVQQYLPWSFLYILTGDQQYKDKLLSLQINGKYWKVSSSKYYDTALALLPFQSDSSLAQKSGSQDYLLSVQGQNGCWDNSNLLNTAFILSSVWPRDVSNGGGGSGTIDNGCLASNYYCTSSAGCTGQVLSNYTCSGYQQVCCTTPEAQTTCTGSICNANQNCQGGQTSYTSDLQAGQICCNTGTCVDKTPATDNSTLCSSAGGTCSTSTSCSSGYSENSLYNCNNGGICCIQNPKHSSLWLIILFGILILLTIFGFMYKDKLKEFIDKKRGDNGSSNTQNPFRRGPPGYPPRNVESFRRPVTPVPPRKIIPRTMPPRRPTNSRPLPNPPRYNPNSGSRPKPKTPKELEEVLKKLKEMGK